MADTKERKIAFLTLVKKQWRSQAISNYDEIGTLISYIGKKKKLERQMDFQDSKFCFLDSYSIDKSAGMISGYFSSAKHKFRPPLIDQKTGEERPSPKRMTEGEKEKTHFAIKVTQADTFLLLEQNGNGVSPLQLMNYLNRFLKENLKKQEIARDFSIDFLKIGRDNFIEILNGLKRVKTAEIFLDKSLLGSQFLNFSNRIVSLQNNLVLTAAAIPTESMKETAIDIFNSFSGDKGISRVRIKGVDTNGAETTLDTSFIEMSDSLKVNLNTITGEPETTELLSGLKALIKPLS